MNKLLALIIVCCSCVCEAKTDHVWLYATKHRQTHYHLLQLDQRVILRVDANGHMSMKIGLATPKQAGSLGSNMWNHIVVKQNRYHYTLYVNGVVIKRVFWGRVGGVSRKPKPPTARIRRY
jgi:hypothetical protein